MYQTSDKGTLRDWSDHPMWIFQKIDKIEKTHVRTCFGELMAIHYEEMSKNDSYSLIPFPPSLFHLSLMSSYIHAQVHTSSCFSVENSLREYRHGILKQTSISDALGVSRVDIHISITPAGCGEPIGISAHFTRSLATKSVPNLLIPGASSTEPYPRVRHLRAIKRRTCIWPNFFLRNQP